MSAHIPTTKSNPGTISSDEFESDGLDPKPKYWVTLGDPDYFPLPSLRNPTNKPHMTFNFLNRLLRMACNFLRRWFRGDESRYQNFLHSYDQFSMAVAPANVHNEDRSQLVSRSLTDRVNGHSGVFVGIYDGHGLEGATCSQFFLDNLFENFKNAMQNHDAVNPEVIQEAYHRTEVAFRGSRGTQLAEQTTTCSVRLVLSGWGRVQQCSLCGECWPFSCSSGKLAGWGWLE